MKPSKLIRMALSDLEAAVADGAEVEMGEWYAKNKDGQCFVCLAGAVLYKDFELDPGESLWGPGYLGRRKMISRRKIDQLKAIDRFRMGDILGGLSVLGIAPPGAALMLEWPVAQYSDSPSLFTADMLALAEYLEGFDL